MLSFKKNTEGHTGVESSDVSIGFKTTMSKKNDDLKTLECFDIHYDIENNILVDNSSINMSEGKKMEVAILCILGCVYMILFIVYMVVFKNQSLSN
jgi:hypothetical protein